MKTSLHPLSDTLAGVSGGFAPLSTIPGWWQPSFPMTTELAYEPPLLHEMLDQLGLVFDL